MVWPARSGVLATLDRSLSAVARGVARLSLPEIPLSGHSSHHRLRLVSRLFLIFAVLQVLDGLSTFLLLGAGGTELNPLSGWLLRGGLSVFIAVKLALAFLLVALVPLLERDRGDHPSVAWTVVGLDAIYLLAVASNLAQVVLFA